MREIVFDTETTGFKPGNICQLSYIISDGGAETGENYYFKVDYVEPGAEGVHSLSVESLDELSGGHTFGESASRICDDFKSCPFWIAHNFPFDESFINAEFHRSGLRAKPERYACTMRHFTPIMKLPQKWARPGVRQGYKYPTLSELIAFMGLSDSDITEYACSAFRIGRQELKRHDARFDCAATYMCYKLIGNHT